MTEQRLSVLFLTRYPFEGASSRYRVYQYIPYFEALGIDCKTQSFMDERLYAASFRSGGTLRKIWLTLSAVARRVRVVLNHRDYDLIYMQRELLPFGPPVLEMWMKWRGSRLVFDIDDALFIKKPSRFNPLATRLRSPKKTILLCRTVDHVVTGNEWLAERAREFGGVATTVEVAEDVSRFNASKSRENSENIVIGWLGSTSTAKYLDLIAPVLRRIRRRYKNIGFIAVGSGSMSMRGVNWETRRWCLDEERASLAEFDIGLMPLPNEDWALGKSGGKARTYMAAGVVPVCSAVGYNLELVTQGRTGCLCSRLGDWYLSLVRLIEDADKRNRMAIACRSEVEFRFDPRTQASVLAGVIRSVADEGARGLETRT